MTIRSAIAYLKAHPYTALLIGVLLLSAIVHGANMFQFPYYENDEAVYVSQAWAVSRLGELAPYTYWYDHAPAGWFLISLWAKLTGGYFTFGPAVHSGRVLMLVLHVASTFFLYFIGKRITGNRYAGLIAALFFSLSPLALYFQRRVLLDNIMVFWMLASAALLLVRRLKLRHVLASAACFAIACLSKETAVFLLPAYAYLAWKSSHPYNRTLAVMGWLFVAGVIISLYPLYALIQSEFFPYGSRFGGDAPHVSLVETLRFQASRPGGSVFNPAESLFWQNMRRWTGHDFALMIGGLVSSALLLRHWIRSRSHRIGFAFLLVALSFLFLMRGGVVIEFYVIPLIPVLALALGIALSSFIDWLAPKLARWKTWRYPPGVVLPNTILSLIAIAYLTFGTTYEGLNIYTADQVRPQRAAMAWIRENAQEDDVIVTDNYLWLDLNAPENPSGKVFPNAEWYWKVERDSEIKDGMLGGVPDRINYVLQTPQVVIDTRTSDFKLIARTLDQSKPIVRFDNDNWSVIIWGQQSPEMIMKRSWHNYKKRFIDDEGKVLDLERPGTYTSQAQSYALLRAVWMDDKETYDRVLGWTVDNLQYPNGTFRGVYDPGDTGQVSFTDADQDIALSLIFASRQWGAEPYRQRAQQVLEGIWSVDVATYNGRRYATAGNWARHGGGITMNPSYLSPAWYRVFASFDPSRPWEELVATSYQTLRACTTGSLGAGAGALPADWCNLDTGTGAYEQSRPPQPVSTDYSIDAYRVPWRVALDYHWFGAPEAEAYLRSLSFLSREFERTGELQASYQHSGAPRDRYESVAMYAGSLGHFLVSDPALAERLYREKIRDQFYENETQSYWQDPNNYYIQNWAWFATGLYDDRLPNIWAGE